MSGSSETIPTVLDNLKSQGTISDAILGMFYPPYSANTVGSVTFGGTNKAHFSGGISYTSLTKANPANEYWGIDQSITYGSKEIASMTSGIVDSGTTMILLATGMSGSFDE